MLKLVITKTYREIVSSLLPDVILSRDNTNALPAVLFEEGEDERSDLCVWCHSALGVLHGCQRWCHASVGNCDEF